MISWYSNLQKFLVLVKAHANSKAILTILNQFWPSLVYFCEYRFSNHASAKHLLIYFFNPYLYFLIYLKILFYFQLFQQEVPQLAKAYRCVFSKVRYFCSNQKPPFFDWKSNSDQHYLILLLLSFSLKNNSCRLTCLCDITPHLILWSEHSL